MALTKTRTFESAVKGWTVTRLVGLDTGHGQSCELCGTRFWRGAVVKHLTSRATILVGGTCLKTLQRHRFPRSFNFRKARRFTLDALRRRYGGLIDPGTWINWIIENAPRTLAQAAADLQTFRTVLGTSVLARLVQFHDHTRLFPRKALLGETRLLEKALGKMIPAHITIDQARAILRKAEPKLGLLDVRVLADDYAKKFVLPFVASDRDLQTVWQGLTALERRGVVALVALDERAAERQEPMCTDEVASQWPSPGARRPLLAWNPKVGLGFVGEDDGLEKPKAYVWLWRSERYQKSIYNLEYWRGIRGCSSDAVVQVEMLAFRGRVPDVRPPVLDLND